MCFIHAASMPARGCSIPGFACCGAQYSYKKSSTGSSCSVVSRARAQGGSARCWRRCARSARRRRGTQSRWRASAPATWRSTLPLCPSSPSSRSPWCRPAAGNAAPSRAHADCRIAADFRFGVLHEPSQRGAIACIACPGSLSTAVCLQIQTPLRPAFDLTSIGCLYKLRVIEGAPRHARNARGPAGAPTSTSIPYTITLCVSRTSDPGPYPNIKPMAYAGPARQVRAQEGGLNVSSVIFALALLRLPQLYMCTYFVRGVETVSELRISLRRLDGFLSLPEPPPPAGAGARAGAGASGPPGAPDVPVRGAHVLLMVAPTTHATPHATTHAPATHATILCCVRHSSVTLRTAEGRAGRPSAWRSKARSGQGAPCLLTPLRHRGSVAWLCPHGGCKTLVAIAENSLPWRAGGRGSRAPRRRL